MTIEQRVREFVLENFYVSDPALISNDTLLVTKGFIDSTGLLEVIAFIEEQFGIVVADEETTPENLESIGRIAAFVNRKLRGPPGAGGAHAAA
ncbi:MAG TPA: acyl carrier protein [Anaeromyxobacteraceae bacterium]|nr:acyl carrier protein [Anaeromyxobacteraceae bacterium]